MNSYFLCVTQPYNAGDLLINRLLIVELSKYGNVYVDCHNCPADFRVHLIGNSDNVIDVEKQYGFSLKKGAILSFARFAKVNKVGLYTQSPGPLNRITSIPLRFSFFVIRKVLAILHIPFIRIGNCCSAAIATQTNVIESGNVHYYVRSKQGTEFLRQFQKDNIHYIPDLAYLFRDYAIPVLKKKIAVMSFRKVDDYDSFIVWLKDCINKLKSNNYKIVFYHQVKRDSAFMNQLYSNLGDDTIDIKKDIVWYDSFDFYEDKEIVVSNRLHCLLVGAMYEAIPYAYIDNGRLVRKIQDVFDSSMGIHSNEFIADIASNKQLLLILEDLLDHKTTIRQIVNENAELCRTTIESIMSTC